MGDENTQTQQQPSWWAPDASDERFAPSTFGDPVEWPDTQAWEQLLADAAPPADAPYVPRDFDFDLGPPAGGADDAFADLERRWNDGADAPTELHLEALPESIWAAGLDDGGEDTRPASAAALAGALGGATSPVAGGAAGPAAGGAARTITIGGTTAGGAPPLPVAEPAARPARRFPLAWPAKFGPRSTSIGMIAVAAVVSLILVGMFLTVRARDDLRTQTSRLDSGKVATDSSTTVPRAVTTTTPPAPPSTISLADLAAADAAATDGAGGTGATAGSAGATATTAPRATSPTGSSGAATPATQPTNTTAAPQPEPTSPTTTAPPAEDTTTTPTTVRRPTTTVTFPQSATWTLPPGITLPNRANVVAPEQLTSGR